MKEPIISNKVSMWLCESPTVLLSGEVVVKMALVSFEGIGKLQMFPSQQAVHTLAVRYTSKTMFPQHGGNFLKQHIGLAAVSCLCLNYCLEHAD